MPPTVQYDALAVTGGSLIVILLTYVKQLRLVKAKSMTYLPLRLLMLRALLAIGLLTVFAMAQAHTLRIGVSESMPSLPIYVAESQGFFKKNGVDVTLINCADGGQCVRNMLAGETDFSTSTELPVVINSFTDKNFGILTSFVTVPDDLKIIARVDRGVTSLASLKGKKIGYMKGNASHYLLEAVLVYGGIAPRDVKLREITPKTALSSLAARKVDAVCIWEPYASNIFEELGGGVQLISIPKLYTRTFNLVATQSVISSNPDDIKRVLLALEDSVKFIKESPESAIAIAAQRFNVSPTLINKIFSNYRFQLSLNRSLMRTMEGQSRWAIRGGHVDASLPQPNYSNFVYPLFLKAIDPGAVSLQ